MKALHILTPVKDSIELTIETIRAIAESEFTVPYTYTVYNDFSTDENTRKLQELSEELHFRLVNLADVTDHPSPNYLLVLQMAQKEAHCAIAAAVTVDENGEINYPYLYAKGDEGKVLPEKKHCSFCCSLLTPDFLRAFDFHNLDSGKNWFDVTISHKALSLGFKNYLFTTLPVWHRPHGSRPWKHLKHKNPLKYYWLKYTKGLDKI